MESGKGFLEKNGKIYKVKEGECFVIFPGENCKYYPDRDDPWFYRWIGFDGELTSSFASMPSVFPYKGDIFKRMSDTENISSLREYKLAGLLFEFYSELFDLPRRDPIQYIYDVRNYIELNYMHDITVEGIAEQLNLNRRYLSRIFKEKTGMTIRDHLLMTRIIAAENCLEGGMSVSETASNCGFSDVSNFSKRFKSYRKISPADYRKKFE